jgi:HSP20 family protein
LCQKFSAHPALLCRLRTILFVFKGFAPLARLAFRQLFGLVQELNIKTKPLKKGKNMKLVTYQRPGLAWPTFGRLSSLHDELDQLFETPLRAWAPALDVQEDKDKFTVNLELPGLKREDISVQLEDGQLTISGERKAATIVEGTEVHRQERFYGKFSRVLTLPTTVVSGQVKAGYKDGILTVTLPKAEAAKPKQIDVSVN